ERVTTNAPPYTAGSTSLHLPTELNRNPPAWKHSSVLPFRPCISPGLDSECLPQIFLANVRYKRPASELPCLTTSIHSKWFCRLRLSPAQRAAHRVPCA